MDGTPSKHLNSSKVWDISLPCSMNDVWWLYRQVALWLHSAENGPKSAVSKALCLALTKRTTTRRFQGRLQKSLPLDLDESWAPYNITVNCKWWLVGELPPSGPYVRLVNECNLDNSDRIGSLGYWMWFDLPRENETIQFPWMTGKRRVVPSSAGDSPRSSSSI